MSETRTLAQRVHDAYARMVEADDDLAREVTAACGPTGDEEDMLTDGYDNSIEVWGVGEIDLGAATAKLKALGFDRVWLHHHPTRTNCRCPCR